MVFQRARLGVGLVRMGISLAPVPVSVDVDVGVFEKAVADGEVVRELDIDYEEGWSKNVFLILVPGLVSDMWGSAAVV